MESKKYDVAFKMECIRMVEEDGLRGIDISRKLIQRLSKRNRKLVLRIIDDKDQICADTSLDSFIQGFRLGVMLTSELLNENDGVLRDTVE